MQTGPFAAVTRVPDHVRNMILNEIASENIWLFDRGRCEAVTVGDMRSSSFSIPMAESPPAVGCELDNNEHLLLYDLMRVRNGQVMFENDHFSRIRQNCILTAPTACDAANVSEDEDLGKLSTYIEGVRSTTRDFIKCNPWENGDVNLKFVTWVLPSQLSDVSTAERRSELLRTLSYAVYYVTSFFPPEDWYEEGTRYAMLYDAQRHTPNAKILQVPLRERAKALQQTTNAFEVLLVSDNRRHYLVPEGSRSNYLIVSGDESLLCSLEEDILVGITLRVARRAAACARLPPLRHRKLVLGDICLAKSIAMLGTSPGVLPIKEIQVFYDEESKQNFLLAMEDYMQDKDEEIQRAVINVRGRILNDDGLLRLESPSCDTLKRLRAAYEAEALL
ncbi:Aminotransferase class IV, putative [Trypanosoma equiperdum]|uniref:Aminotransferase class IV n=2 Tax=Trypanozoon TaxID=39700 RepID=Q584G3_TRYB2|nr:hypothetical protein, conserved [Trypanosoma brucei brucei TREU927]AAX79042.1 hypothetical protein, conserved [Trypanosoma brucei]AAZ10815.1 hypothetical protein, conserved [Trypanosoma brucei brucei TREU927]SCU68201.1 Aminotransferase class IV, putative [Trypanosoma equiperdum]